MTNEDPERWSEAYEHQEQCGFVFAPRQRVPLVASASRIVFYEAFGVVMDQQADRAAKVTDVVPDEWVEAARENHLCSPECAEVLQGSRPRLIPFRGEDLRLPDDWSMEDRIRACAMHAAKEARCQIRVIVPMGGGVPSSAKRPADIQDRLER